MNDQRLAGEQVWGRAKLAVGHGARRAQRGCHLERWKAGRVGQVGEEGSGTADLP